MFCRITSDVFARFQRWMRSFRVPVEDDRGRTVLLCATPTASDFPDLPWWHTTAMVERVGDPWITELRFQSKQQLWDHAAWVVVFLIVQAAMLLWPGLSWWWRFGIAAVAFIPIGLVIQLYVERRLRRRGRRKIIAAYLVASRCPSCRGFIDINPGADGCSECSCGSAWRVPEGARRDVVPDDASFFPSRAGPRLARGECPWCGYSRAGLDAEALCPECGRAREGRLADPPRVGRPVCARCGGCMRGREEGRACADCGVMYGVEWEPEEALGELAGHGGA